MTNERMTKVYNTRETMPDDMIAGYVAAYPAQIALGANPRVVRRKSLRTHGDKVAVLIGNGSGHEPIAMGFVGRGCWMPTWWGRVHGASPDAILDGIDEVTGPAGAVLLISRHEGDVINGNAAAFMAQDKGLDVRPLLMYDDISSRQRAGGRARGAAGTMFIYKILGAAAEAGMGLDDLMALGEACGRHAHLGAALFPGTSPLSGETMFTLPPGEMQSAWGSMVSAGPAIGRLRPRELVRDMVDALLADRPIAAGTETLVLINGSGGTTMMELLTIYGEVAGYLEKQGVPARSPMIGSYSTTQEMGGFSISLFTPTADMARYWRAPHGAPLFPHLAGMGD